MPTPRRAAINADKHKPASAPAFAKTESDGMTSIRVGVGVLPDAFEIDRDGPAVDEQLKSPTRRSARNLQASHL